MMKLVSIFIVFLLVGLTGCATQSSHVVIGKVRQSISPDEVRIFFNPPPKYEEVAFLTSNSYKPFVISEQAKMDLAVSRLKVEAARLGANGVLISSVGSSGGVMVGNTTGFQTGSTYTGTSLGVSGGGVIKEFTGMAIFVTD